MTTNIDHFIKGYRHFQAATLPEKKVLLEDLAEHGQSPKAMFIACCDSRVNLTKLFEAEIGDMFVVQNVANVIPEYENRNLYCSTSSALAYGVNSLKVKDLIILGHSCCGGVNARVNANLVEVDDFVKQWVNIIPCDYNIKDVDTQAKASLLNSYQNCLSYPWLKSAVDAGELNIHLWFFDIGAGQVDAYSHEEKCFSPL